MYCILHWICWIEMSLFTNLAVYETLYDCKCLCYYLQLYMQKHFKQQLNTVPDFLGNKWTMKTNRGHCCPSFSFLIFAIFLHGIRGTEEELCVPGRCFLIKICGRGRSSETNADYVPLLKKNLSGKSRILKSRFQSMTPYTVQLSFGYPFIFL